MTWEQLLLLLQNMHQEKHSCMGQGQEATRVTAIFNDEEYFVDILESLTSGKIVFTIDCLSAPGPEAE